MNHGLPTGSPARKARVAHAARITRWILVVGSLVWLGVLTARDAEPANWGWTIAGVTLVVCGIWKLDELSDRRSERRARAGDDRPGAHDR